MNHDNPTTKKMTLSSDSSDICPCCSSHRGIKLPDGTIGICNFCKNMQPRNFP